MDLNIDIKKIRTDLGLNQTEFASRLDVTQTLISKIEAGKSHPTFEMLKKIHNTFGLQWGLILFGTGLDESIFTDNVGESNNNYYESKNKQTIESNKKLIDTIEKLVDNLLSKDKQIDKLIDTIQQLSKK